MPRELARLLFLTLFRHRRHCTDTTLTHRYDSTHRTNYSSRHYAGILLVLAAGELAAMPSSRVCRLP